MPKVLVVEDDALSREVCVRWLTKQGHEVRGVESAEEAFAALKSERYAVILLDNILPGKTGLEALPALKRSSKAKIIMMTGHADDELEKDLKLLGAGKLLRKPLDFRLLSLAVKEALK